MCTSNVAEKGRTRNPRSRSATARLAIRMCVGPRRLELKRTAAKISKLPPMVRRTMTESATATTKDIQFIVTVNGASVGDMPAALNVDSPAAAFIMKTARPDSWANPPSPCCCCWSVGIVVLMKPLVLLLASSIEPIIPTSSGTTFIESKYTTLLETAAESRWWPPIIMALLRFLAAIKSIMNMASGCILPTPLPPPPPLVS